MLTQFSILFRANYRFSIVHMMIVPQNLQTLGGECFVLIMTTNMEPNAEYMVAITKK